MEMDMINAKQAAERWGVTPRFVQMLCKQGQIAGAVQWGRTWMIPADAARPLPDKKRGNAEGAEETADMPLPRKTPFLDMTNLYHTPGCAAPSIQALAYNPEAQTLLAAEIAYLQGDMESVYQKVNYLLDKHSGFYAILSAGMLLGLCAIWKGDLEMWNNAKIHICEAPCKSDNDRDIVSLSLTALDSAVYDTSSFPDWFRIGNFEPLHPDAVSAAKVFYAKYLYATAYAVASNQQKLESIQGLSLMAMLPYTLEPMISQAVVDKTAVTELYLRLTCAAAYHNSGNREQAIRHLDRAIALALPDRLYGILAEYRHNLDTLMDSRLSMIDPDALGKVIELYKSYRVGWAKLGSVLQNRRVESTLTAREREVAKLAAFGMSNAEIAAKLHVSPATVKQSIRIAIFKGGVNTRDELATIL